MFTFTPLLGAQSHSSATQSLLEFEGGVKILVDVGWDESFDAQLLLELEKHVSTISIILLTHPTLAHLGAYAHCCKNIPFFNRIPCYATTPVLSLGRTLLQDLYNSTPLAASVLPATFLAESSYATTSLKSDDSPNVLLPPPSNEEIADYFASIHPLKYSQPHQPTPSPSSSPVNGLTITAYRAGHTLGGTIWHIQHGSESVVYAVDWNQARENVLSGAAWLGSAGNTGAEVVEQLRRPTSLVCSSKGSDGVAVSGGWRRRDEVLLEHIRNTVRDGGSVLIPCDSSARVLELSYLLENVWSDDKSEGSDKVLQGAKLFLASRTCSATLRYARSMLEWMDESIVREFETNNTQGQNSRTGSRGEQPFDLKNVQLIERKTQLDRALSTMGPKVFLASDSSLDWGFSRDIAEYLSTSSNNLIILGEKIGSSRPQPQKSDTGIRAAILEKLSGQVQDEGDNLKATVASTACDGLEVELRDPVVSPLSSNEMPLYQQYLARQRQRQDMVQVDKGGSSLETSADVVDDRSSESSSSSEESDNEYQGKVLNTSTALTSSKNKLGLTDEELGINILLRRKNVYDYDVRGKRGREKVFPFVSKRRRNDEFGDLIRPEDYLRAEERDEVDGQDLTHDTSKAGGAMGQKKKWGGREAGRRASDGGNKRRKNGNAALDKDGEPEGDDDLMAEEDESEESDYEPAEPRMMGPTKVTFSTRKIPLNFKVAAVDYTGIHDRRSLQMLIPLIRPQKLILTAGNAEETGTLAADCKRLLESSIKSGTSGDAENILVPTIGATVNASVDTNAWTVKLSQSLLKQLHWQNVRGLGLVTINGQLEASMPSEDTGTDDGERDTKRQKLESDGKETDSKAEDGLVEEQTPVLTALPANLAATTRSVAQSIHVGDLRLAELRKLLQSTGHIAEFKGEGTLLVDGIVAVRKTGVGRIEVESGSFSSGPLNPAAQQQLGRSFFSVKKQIYEGLAVVAAR